MEGAPSLHFLKKMDKAFCIALRFSFENLWQCNGWPSKPLGGRAPLPDPNSRILKQCNRWPSKPRIQLVQWFIKMAFLMPWIRAFLALLSMQEPKKLPLLASELIWERPRFFTRRSLRFLLLLLGFLPLMTTLFTLFTKTYERRGSWVSYIPSCYLLIEKLIGVHFEN